MTGIFLDIDAINKRCGSADWFFNLQPDGMLVILLRKRNVCETENAAKYLKQEKPNVIEGALGTSALAVSEKR